MHCALWFECVMRWERSYRVCLSPIYADGTSDEIIYRGEGAGREIYFCSHFQQKFEWRGMREFFN